jgi:hypothetical protein
VRNKTHGFAGIQPATVASLTEEIPQFREDSALSRLQGARFGRRSGTMDEITNAPQEAMEKTPEELVIWVRERRSDDSYRQSIVQLEFERRVAVAQIETAKSAKLNSKWMLCSVIVLALTGVLAAVFQYLAWMYPHLAK